MASSKTLFAIFVLFAVVFVQIKADAVDVSNGDGLGFEKSDGFADVLLQLKSKIRALG